MSKVAIGFAILLVSAGAASAQFHDASGRLVRPPQSTGVRGGFGNVVAPGGVSGFGNVVLPGGNAAQDSHAARLGGIIAGRPWNDAGARIGGRPAPRAPRQPRVVAYPVPVYYGGYYYDPYYGAPPQPPVTIQNFPPAQSPVIINQYYTTPNPRPVVREYADSELSAPGFASGLHAYQAPAPVVPDSASAVSIGPPSSGEGSETGARGSSEATVYLIAYLDGSIHAALGYWLEGDLLHYTTLQGAHNLVSTNLVDVEFSLRLNRERGVAFELPVTR